MAVDYVILVNLPHQPSIHPHEIEFRKWGGARLDCDADKRLTKSHSGLQKKNKYTMEMMCTLNAGLAGPNKPKVTRSLAMRLQRELMAAAVVWGTTPQRGNLGAKL